jgi:CRP-like cAMP-binding protein
MSDPLENHILSGLSQKEYARIASDLQVVALKADQVLCEPGVVMQWAYFLDTATVSILSQAESGASIEVSLVGPEGVVGIPIVLRTLSLPYRVVVQRPGMARRMKADVLRKEFDRCRQLHELLLHYLHTLIVQLAQSSACNQFHTIRQRLCRWLLTSQDLSGSDELRSTQELLSQMLGVNRGSANQAAGSLQKARLIRYRRGHITILNRSGLEAATCECYRIIRTEFERFFPRSYGASPIRGGSDAELIAGVLSDAPLCPICIAKIVGVPSQQIEAALATISTALKLKVQSGPCSSCLEQKAATYALATTAKPPRRPVDKAEALWRFLEQRRGNMFCTPCLSTALGSHGRLDRAVISAEGRSARRVYGVCAMCGQPRLVCGLTAN